LSMSANNKVRKRIALFLRARKYTRMALVVIFLFPTPSQVPAFIHRSLAMVPLVLPIPPRRSATRIVSHQVGQRGCKPLERDPRTNVTTMKSRGSCFEEARACL